MSLMSGVALQSLLLQTIIVTLLLTPAPCFKLGSFANTMLSSPHASMLRREHTVFQKARLSVDGAARTSFGQSIFRAEKSRVATRMSSMPDEILECSEENVLRVIEMARAADPDMFGRSPRAQNIGINGDVSLSSLDGPFVILRLEGRFWHKRRTVMSRVANMLANYIPEIADVDIEEEDMLLDVWEERDPSTGEVVSRVDRRAPDFNGDRETMEYNGVDPDDRGPFGQTLFG